MNPHGRPSPAPDRLDQLAAKIHAFLGRTASSADDRVDILAGAMVVEAFRPYWNQDRSPAEAYEALRVQDPELADAVDALAPMLLARLESREESALAVAAVEDLLLRTR